MEKLPFIFFPFQGDFWRNFSLKILECFALRGIVWHQENTFLSPLDSGCNISLAVQIPGIAILAGWLLITSAIS